MSMEKVSNLISKKVISLEDANQVGYVLNVIFDDRIKYFTGLIIVDDESENSFVLQKEDIYAIADETVTIKSSNVLQYNISQRSNNPIGKTVYDSRGNNLGKVLDVEINGKVVKRIITDFCEFPQKYVRKSGDNFIIYGAYRKEKKKDFKEDLTKINAQVLPPVTISMSLNTVLKPESPVRIYANPKSLIGKIVTHDILGYNNELIAQKNDVINQRIINKAKLHNKLNILNYYSK